MLLRAETAQAERFSDTGHELTNCKLQTANCELHHFYACSQHVHLITELSA